MSKKIIIVGAGPGGLSAAMSLCKDGYDVQVFEEKPYVGGRNGNIKLGEYNFDIGPTFFLMKSVLENIFESTGRKLEDYVKLYNLETMYRLSYSDEREFLASSNKEKMKTEMERLWKGSYKNYERYLAKEEKKYNRLAGCFKVPYGKITDLLTPQFMRTIPVLNLHQTLYNSLKGYFKTEELTTSFAFQAKYIGMSPWKAPSIFSIISFIEHKEGICHVEGGLNQLSKAMAKVAEEDGCKIRLNTKVKKLVIEKKNVVGVELENGEIIKADDVILNADFAHAMTNIVDDNKLKKWKKKNIDKKLFSCSTFMLYIGLDKIYEDIPHHNIIFSKNYKNNVDEITQNKVLSEDPSFYIQNASITDKTLAPNGGSALYVLVPIANQLANIDWSKEKERYKNKIYELLETRGKLTDIKKHVKEELIITPDDWVNNFSVYNGATFSLGHNISQMLIFRPHNEFEDFKNCYLVGGGTHPGSGLPNIYESGQIAVKFIKDKYK